MKSPEHIPSNQVLLLGRGVDRIDDSNGYSLSRASHARAMAAARYHADHRLWFGAHDSRIVVSGGYAGVAADQEAPPVEFREARLMRKVMMEAGVPGPLIEVEDQSVSTTDNFAKVLENGFFAGQRDIVRTPGVCRNTILAEARVAARLPLQFQNLKVPHAVALEVPSRAQAGNTATNNHDGDATFTRWLRNRLASKQVTDIVRRTDK